MPELTDRGKQFQTAIACFIEDRRAAKEKDKNYDPAKYEHDTWLSDAARRVGQIQSVTHVLKATHPDARGTSLHIAPSQLPGHAEIGSHVLGDGFAEDVVGNAAALDVFKFLRIEVDGRRLLDWAQADDADLKSALSDNPETAAAWVSAFASLVRTDNAAATHPMAKQVYWLCGDDPLDDAQYHLLQPMFSSTLAHAVHADIQDARFGEANKTARQAFRERKPSDMPYRDYRNLVARKLGGTKPQNISQLNSERGGVNYLLSSLPPPAWKPAGIQLLKQESAFTRLIGFGGMRKLVGTLIEFLKDDPDPTMETREHRKTIEQAIGQELAMFGVAVRGQYAAGWTRDPECGLPECEQLWLDPDRTELEVRSDPQQPQWTISDEAFIAAYENGSWPDDVAERFGNWLNARLREAGLVTVSLPERNHWARQAILDVAWPVPLRRRAAGGAA